MALDTTFALTLVSHELCPYVQRAAILLGEKAVAFERVHVDLASKPDWFRAISPLGKVPLLKVERAGDEDAVLFESAVILEYLDETQASPLHPGDPLERARHRSWIEFGSAILNAIARFYNARDEASLGAEAVKLTEMFARVEQALVHGPWFAGDRFGLVDAVYGPIFRYFDVFDEIEDFGVLTGKPKLLAWRGKLAARPTVRQAVQDDYPARLRAFLVRRDSALSHRMAASG